MARVGDRRRHPGHVVVADEGQRQERRRRSSCRWSDGASSNQLRSSSEPDRLPELVLGERVQADSSTCRVVAVDHLAPRTTRRGGRSRTRREGAAPERRRARRRRRRAATRRCRASSQCAMTSPTQPATTGVAVVEHDEVTRGPRTPAPRGRRPPDAPGPVAKQVGSRRARAPPQRLRATTGGPADVVEHAVEKDADAALPAGGHQRSASDSSPSRGSIRPWSIVS